MRRAAAVLILSSLCSLVLLATGPRAAEPQGQAATTPTAVPTPAVAGAPAAPGAVSAPATAAPATPVMEVAYDKGLLTVRAEGADLALLLKKIGQAAGIPVDIGEGISGKVSVVFGNVAVEEAVARLLEAADSKNFAAEFQKEDEKGGFTLRKISVVRKAAGQAAGASTASAKKELRTEASVAAWLKEKYGTDWYVDWREDHARDHVRLFEGKIPGLEPPTTPEEARAMADRLLPEFVGLLQIPLEQLKYTKTSANTRSSFDLFYRHQIDGVPVDSSRIIITYFKDTQMFQLTNQLHYGIDVSTKPELTAEEAVKRADNYFRALTPAEDIKRHEGYGPLLQSPPELTIHGVPVTSDRPHDLIYHLVWVVEYSGATYYIDAHAGDLVQEALTEIPALESVSGELKGRRYGHYAGTQLPYTDNLTYDVVGLPRLPIWTLSDPWPQLPSDPAQKTRDDGKFILPINCTDPGSSSYLYSRLQTEKFRIYEGPTDTSYLRWDGYYDGYTWEFPDNAPGHQPNLYHQLQRGFSWLADNTATGDGVPGNEPPFLPIHAAVPMGQTLGRADRNKKLEFTEQGALSSDIIFHELTHSAVYTIRGPKEYLGIGQAQWGINEGLANYFACRMNNDQWFDTFARSKSSGQLYHMAQDLDFDRRTDVTSSMTSTAESVPMDWNGDKVTDSKDWEHYDNGFVFASMLWDLSPGGQEDTKIWEAVERMPKDTYSPGDFYKAIRDRQIDSKLLWDAYSNHEMNLRADIRGSSVNLSWLEYPAAGATYELMRFDPSTSSWDPIPLANPGATTAEDKGAPKPQGAGPLVAGTTYYYRLEVNGIAQAIVHPMIPVDYTGLVAPVASVQDVKLALGEDADQYEFKLTWTALNVSAAPACSGATMKDYSTSCV